MKSRTLFPETLRRVGIQWVYVCLFSAFVVCSQQLAQFSSRVNDSSLRFLYSLTEGQSNLQAVTAADSQNSPLGSLKVPSGDWPPDSTGLISSSTSGFPASTGNDSACLSSITSSGGFTWELWILPGAVSYSSAIAGFGSYVTGQTYVPECASVLNYAGLRLVQNGQFLEVQYGAGSSSRGCTAPDVYEITTIGLLHVIITGSSSATASQIFQSYINASPKGNSIVSPNFSFFYDANGNPTPLALFPVFSSSIAWPGRILLMSFYSREFNQTDVNNNYNAYIPNSKPYASNYGQTGNQNTLFNITIVATDFDITYGTPLKNTAGTSLLAVPQTLSYYITSLPALGTLYYFNSSDSAYVQILSLPLALTDVSHVVSYQPPTNVFTSPVTLCYITPPTFTFQSFDGYAYSTNTTITLSINHVNQPPVASATTQGAYPGGTYNLITLSGTDPDITCGLSQYIASANITSLPANGSLYLTLDGVNPNGTALTSTPVLIPQITTSAGTGIFVLWAGPLPPTSSSGQSIVYWTSFNFTVTDSLGLVSLAANTTNITVNNNLYAQSFTSTSTEDLPVYINLTGSNKANQSFSYYLQSVPLGGGHIFLPNSATPNTAVGSTLPVLVPGGIILYQPHLYYFGSPLESLNYYIQADSTGFRSGTATLTFDVNFHNHPPTLSAVSPAAGVTLSVPIDVSPSLYTIVSVNLTDPDTIEGSNKYTFSCTIQTNGFGIAVSIGNTSYLPLLTFAIGDGKTDAYQNFIGSMDNTIAVLSDLLVECSATGSKTIIITVTEEGVTPAYSASLTIPVSCYEDAATSAADSSSLPEVYIILAWILIILLPVTCCGCYCLNKYRTWRQEKGHKVVHLPLCLHCIVQQWRSVARKRYVEKHGQEPAYARDDVHYAQHHR